MDIDNLADLRDVTIVAYMIAGTVFFLLSIIVSLIAIVILLYVRSAVSNINRALKDNVSPALENVRSSSENVRNAAEFVAEYAVKPVIRVYTLFAGVRRFASVLSGIGRRRSRTEKT